MSLLGEVILNNIQYFLYNARTKNEELYYLISTLHKDDIVSYNIKGEHSHTILNSKTKVESAITKDYILAGIKKNRKSGKIWEFGNSSILNNILDTIFFAKTYTFRDESIMTNETSLIYGKRLKTFSASDKNLIYSFSLEDNLYKSVQIKSSNAEIKLDESKLVISKKLFTNY